MAGRKKSQLAKKDHETPAQVGTSSSPVLETTLSQVFVLISFANRLLRPLQGILRLPIENLLREVHPHSQPYPRALHHTRNLIPVSTRSDPVPVLYGLLKC